MRAKIFAQNQAKKNFASNKYLFVFSYIRQKYDNRDWDYIPVGECFMKVRRCFVFIVLSAAFFVLSTKKCGRLCTLAHILKQLCTHVLQQYEDQLVSNA